MSAQTTIQQLQAAYDVLLQAEMTGLASGAIDADTQAAVRTVAEVTRMEESVYTKNANFFIYQAYYCLREMISRQALLDQLALNTEGGQIAVIRHNSVDCDGVSMADNAVVIPADVDSYLQHCEEISRNADGYYRLSMCPPSMACAF
jgi:hypothetical protein